MKRITKNIIIFLMILFVLSIVIFITMGRGSNKLAILLLIIGHILFGVSALMISVGVCKNDKYNKVVKVGVVLLGVAVMSIVFLMCFGLLHMLKGLSVPFSLGIALVMLLGIISMVIGIIMAIIGAKKQKKAI